MRRHIGTWGIVSAVALVLSACGGGGGGGGDNGSSEREGITKTEVSIGTISDRTGPSAGTQVPWLQGLESLVKRVNDEGGVSGRTIKLLSEDEKSDVPTGLTAYKKLVSQTPVAAILGTNSSSIQAAIVPSLPKDKIPLLAGQATIKESLQPHNDYFFGLAPTYADQADVILARGEDLSGVDKPKVAVIALPVSSGEEFKELVKSRCDAGKCELVASETLDLTATTADAQVQKMVAAKPDFVMFHGSSAGANVFMKSQEKFGSDLTTVAITPAGGPAAFADLKPATTDLYESVQFTTPSSIEVDGTAQMQKDAEAAGYGDATNNVDFVAGYVSGMILAKALENAGDDLSRETLKDGFASVKLDTKGLTGPIEFTDVQRVGSQSLYPLGFDQATKKFVAKADFAEYADAITSEYSPK